MTHIGATGPTPNQISLNPLKLRSWWLNIDRDELAVGWVQTAAGQVAIHAAFLLLLFNPMMRTSHAGLVAVTLLACALYPTKRMLVFCGMGALFFTLRPFQSHHAYVQFEQVWNSIGSGLPFQGGLSAIADSLLQLFDVALELRSGLTVCLWLWLTGGLHLDGAMDTADGLAVSRLLFASFMLEESLDEDPASPLLEALSPSASRCICCSLPAWAESEPYSDCPCFILKQP